MKSASMTKNSEPLRCCVPRKRTCKNLGELAALQIYLLYSNRSPLCLFSCSLLEYAFGTEAARYLLLHDSAVSTIASSVRRRDNSEIEKSRGARLPDSRSSVNAIIINAGECEHQERLFVCLRWRLVSRTACSPRNKNIRSAAVQKKLLSREHTILTPLAVLGALKTAERSRWGGARLVPVNPIRHLPGEVVAGTTRSWI